MSDGTTGDGTTTTDGGDPSGSTSTSGDEFKPITSQADLDTLIGPRLARERAKFGDYEELKAKAAKFDEAADAGKDELTKATERAAAAEAEAQKLPAKVADGLREHLKKLHQISDEDAELFLTATDPELLARQVERLLGRAADARKGGNRVSREGRNQTSAPSDEQAFVNDLFGTGG